MYSFYLAGIEMKRIFRLNNFNCVIYPPAGGRHFI